MTFKDGWHDLPSGGAVEIQNGFPVRVSDKARWNLEETRILEEAKAFANAKLTWAIRDRSRRWTKAALWTIFKAPDRARWNFAGVLPGACERCGEEAGIRFIERAPGEEHEWIGEACFKEIEPPH
ncbi:hypothetical protein [Polyangium mundeleinium]|uniref:Uncharacterized protein n=1 Tax=Polyangium mundeleinium TaxID=2995306 RepID=A0ABT5F590_9BACT|nr:hypothetical protein [Polyangium mundeleinium]MDC0748672.1 hypothetical protein [Polyangium mundeleinium]